jgi:hypothetical protein
VAEVKTQEQQRQSCKIYMRIQMNSLSQTPSQFHHHRCRNGRREGGHEHEERGVSVG